MASLSERLELLLSVNTQGAVASLESFAKNAEKSTASATSSLQKYQSAAKTALGVDDHRRRRHRALAHLGHGVRDGDDAVAVDPEPLVGGEDAGRRLRLLRGGVERQAEADDEAGAERGAALEERATGERDRAIHRVAPGFMAAALWIAARIRW